MALTVTSIGDNQQAPGVTAETYIPDQLIAGDLKIVSASVTITGGADLVRGTLLGQVTEASPGAAVAAGAGGGGANTGTGAITLIAAGVEAKLGTYTIRFTGATAYNVIDPDGIELEPAVAAGAYAVPQIGFTFTAGGTAMVAGDGFTIAIAAGSGKYKTSVKTAVDGSQNPVAVLADAALCATNAADQVSGIYLTGEFNANAMTFDASWTAAAAAAALRPLAIFLKNVGVEDLTYLDPS
jgi:hypothetical protein